MKNRLATPRPLRVLHAGSFGPGSIRLASARRGRVSRPGFTLPEVLATMLLLAIVLPVIMKGISLATSTGDQARRRTEASTLAQSKLDELLGTGSWAGGISQGDFGAEWPDYHWSDVVTDWTQGTQAGLEQLEVHVSWQGRGGEESVVVTTLVYNGVNSANSTSGTSSSSTSSGSGGSIGGGSSGSSAKGGGR